jgi:hypothetical protein
MFGGVVWSGRSTEVATLSSTHASHCLVLGEDERQNSRDDKPGERALNLIQIKDVKPGIHT